MAIEEPRVLRRDDGVEEEAAALIREARGRARKRRMRLVAFALPPAGLVAGVVLLLGSGRSAALSNVTVGPAAAQEAPSPRTFALATMHGTGYQLGIYSAKSGAIVRRLGNFSSRTFTNNGLAYSPDGRAVYYTLIPRRRARSQVFVLRLTRLDVATRRSTFVASGAQPALNPAGTELAYGAFPRGVAVRDLRTGLTRTVALDQLDSAANIMAGTVGWLGNGTDVAIVPAATAWDLMGKQPDFRWCGTSQRHSVIVFVHVPPAPAALTAKCVHVPGLALNGRVAIGPDPAAPNSILVTASALHGRTRIEQISQDGASRLVATISDSLPIAFDADGTHLLYLAGHKPPALTEAKISAGRIINGPWRDRNIGLGAGSW